VADLAAGQIRYALITNEQGGILDDVLVYHLTDNSGVPFYWMVVNASNRDKISDWIWRHLSADEDVTFSDRTPQTAMIAVQGPRALEIAQPLLPVTLSGLKYYGGLATRLAGRDAVVSRTGYTGEDGCEIVVPGEVAIDVWQSLLSAGAEAGVRAAGLGARDTLRLEAAMPLYGHELSEEIDPFQAGLGFAVNLKNRTFPGCDVLEQRRQQGPRRRRVGLALSGRRAARQSCPVLHQGRTVGEVTSGSFSPTLQRPIAMGYVPPEHAEPGTQVTVDIRGQMAPAEIVPLPFYSRSC
jgi:aminomethyltransferase